MRNLFTLLHNVTIDTVPFVRKLKSKRLEVSEILLTFARMMIMEYDVAFIGKVKMTVGIRRRTHEKVQYCITAHARKKPNKIWFFTRLIVL